MELVLDKMATDWIFEIGLCDNRINQSIKITNDSSHLTNLGDTVVSLYSGINPNLCSRMLYQTESWI